MNKLKSFFWFPAVSWLLPFFANSYEPSWGELSSDERLDELKRAVFDYALDQGVNVSASAWLDKNGAIEESVFLVSSLKLENLRVNEFLNDFGFPQAGLVALDPVNNRKACSQNMRFKKRLAVNPVRTQYEGNSSAWLAEESRELVVLAFENAGSLKEIGTLEFKGPKTSSPFLRYSFMPRSAAPNVVLNVGIEVKRKNGFTVDRDGLVRLGLRTYAMKVELAAVENGDIFFSQETALSIPARRSPYEMTTLKADNLMQEEVYSAIQTMIDELTESIKCRPVANLRLADAFEQRRLNGGRDLGLSGGQQFLLLPDSDRFTSMGLEKATNAVALVVIDQVLDFYSTFKLLSGELPEYGSKDFIAIPIDSLDFIKNRT